MAQSTKKHNRTAADHAASLTGPLKDAVIKALAEEARTIRLKTEEIKPPRTSAKTRKMMESCTLPPANPVVSQFYLPKLKKPKRKQAGKDETQVERDVLVMIKEAWPGVEVEAQRRMELTKEHSYTADFFIKADGQEIMVEAKGAKTWAHNRMKFLWAMTMYRWRFFVWAKQHRGGRWTFEVWHALSRLKLKGKRQNPKSMIECAELIRAEIERRDEIAGRGE